LVPTGLSGDLGRDLTRAREVDSSPFLPDMATFTYSLARKEARCFGILGLRLAPFRGGSQNGQRTLLDLI